MTTDNLQTRPRMKYACEQLQRMAQELGPNAQLPTMVQLRESLGVSMHTLNEAVREMEKQGFLRSVHGVGIFVMQPSHVLTGNIGIVGIEHAHLKASQYYHYVLQGVSEFAQQHDQHIILLGSCKELDASALEKVDGVLLCDVEFQECRLKQLPAAMPRVSLFSRGKDAANVLVDDYNGAQMAMRHLLEVGHRRIACLMERGLYVPTQRFAGYCSALEAAGIERSDEWVRLTDIIMSHQDKPAYLYWGREQMWQWIAEGFLETGCTAILAQNDAAAIGVMQALQEAGVQVPRQMSVMGFDGTDLCEHVTPQLSSMKVPLDQIGYTAARELYGQIRQGSRTSHIEILPMQLRPGCSVAAPLS